MARGRQKKYEGALVGVSFKLDRETVDLLDEAGVLLKKSLPEAVRHIEVTKIDTLRTIIREYVRNNKPEG